MNNDITDILKVMTMMVMMNIGDIVNDKKKNTEFLFWKNLKEKVFKHFFGY